MTVALATCVSVALAEGTAVLSTEAAVEALWDFPWLLLRPLGGLHLEGKENLPTELKNLFCEALLYTFAVSLCLAAFLLLPPSFRRILKKPMSRLLAWYGGYTLSGALVGKLVHE